MREGKLRTIVCGSTFGQLYLKALKRLPEQFELVGLLARGSERSKKCVKHYGINLYTDIDQLPDDIDLACVVVRATVLGGEGTELSLKLLARGIHVIQEFPISEKELVSCLRAARQNRKHFRVGNLDTHLPSVRRFIACTQAMLEQQNALYIDVSCSIQVTYPVMHILSEVLPTVHPWKISNVIKYIGPFQVATGVVGNIPITLRIHSEVDPEDPHSYIYLSFSLTIGVEGGRLVLVDTHGPVVWHPILYAPPKGFTLLDEISTTAEVPTHLLENTTEVLGPISSLSYKDILTKQWSRAVGCDLLAMRKMILRNTDSNIVSQRELLCSHLWQSLNDILGYPISRPNPKPLPVRILREAASKIVGYPEEYSNQVSRPKVEKNVFTCTEVAEDEIQEIDAKQVSEFVRRMDEMALSSMLFVLQSQGTLTNPRHEYSKDEILSAAKVASYYRNLILQWLRILTERGYIRQRGERFIGTEPLTSEAMQQRRNQVRESLKDTKLFSSLVIDYFMSHTEWLPQLMSGDKQQAILLMFPEGRMDIADALYRDTISVRYLNKSVAEAVVRIADGKDSLRILEISASTGATTDAVIHRLKASISKQINLDYLFVDVTNFFLTMVRERYEDCPWIHFQTIDINESLFEQGLRTENADIVIATDALNNVRNINEIVRDLMQALVPGGWMLVTEPTREIPVALISQTFMMIPPEDERKDANTTFLSTEQWLKVFYQAGAEKAVALPSDEHILAPIGQKLFIVKKARR